MSAGLGKLLKLSSTLAPGSSDPTLLGLVISAPGNGVAVGGSGVAVAVAAGVRVGVRVGVLIAVAVRVGVNVRVGVRVGVRVAVAIAVAVRVRVGSGVKVGVEAESANTNRKSSKI